MTARDKQIQANILCFLLLFLVSLYRQLSLRYLPDDPFRTSILYAAYCLLLSVWGISIRLRFTQRSMRLFLLLEDLVMLCGLTIRFVQDSFLTNDIWMMRVSGFYVGATLLPMLLLGLYGALGLGQADSYRFSKKWYLLLIPVLVMTFFQVTDEQHHLVWYVVPSEPQPNLEFHPYIGAFVMCGAGLALTVARTLVIFRRNRQPERSTQARLLLALFEPLALLAFSFEYFVVSLQLVPALAGKEVIELYAKLYYAEILTWEVYVLVGLVPVNSNYREIFERATVGMQLLLPDGSQLLSNNAAHVPESLLQGLGDGQFLAIAPGKELHAYRVSAARCFWTKDVSSLQTTIDDLNRIAEDLAQESVLLAEELKVRNQKARLEAKNRIYDTLTAEVHKELCIMEDVIRDHRPGDADRERLCELVVLGTYVKRRCNLQLIERDDDRLDGEDLRLSFQDMVSALNLVGVHAFLAWEMGHDYSMAFSLYAFDLFEHLLEDLRPTLVGVSVQATRAGVCLMFTGRAEPPTFPNATQLPPEGCQITQSQKRRTLLVRVAEKDAADV